MSKILIITLLLSFLSSAMAGKCNKEDAKKSVMKICKLIEANGKGAIPEIAKYRFCDGNYVWIQSAKNFEMILHPIKRKLNGKILKDLTDVDGKKIFLEFDKTAKKKAKGGWVNYKWKKSGAESATAKTSFIKLCGGGLKWIAGSGVWL